MDAKRDPVRCVQCRHEYELPPRGHEIGCPACGGVSWVSTRIPGGLPAQPPPGPAQLSPG